MTLMLTLQEAEVIKCSHHASRNVFAKLAGLPKMSILNNEDGIWKGKYICIDHITVEIMCTDLCEIWIKSEGVTSNNVRGLSGSPGGAVKGRCENAGQSFCQCL